MSKAKIHDSCRVTPNRRDSSGFRTCTAVSDLQVRGVNWRSVSPGARKHHHVGLKKGWEEKEAHYASSGFQDSAKVE